MNRRASTSSILYLLILATTLASGSRTRAEKVNVQPPTFDHDVMAVLSKAGCNMGTCHGNLNGKGGFRLSLRGQDPAHDYLALTRELAGRRVNRNQPDQSLILLKPTASVAHQGGQRFTPSTPEYKVLHAWIAAGAQGPDESLPELLQLRVSPNQSVITAPNDMFQIQAIASFADGNVRDVTRMATYEPSNFVASISADGRVQRESFGEVTVSVRYLRKQVAVRLAFVPDLGQLVSSESVEDNYVDNHVMAKLRSLGMLPSPIADDHVFVRRAFLDVLGLPPTAHQARQFVRDKRTDKRERLIEHLLSRPEFADHWALKWSDLLRNEERMLDATGVKVFHQWIRRCFAEAAPLDEFVRQLVAARGSTYKNPPANYYRSIRDPLVRGETTARLFLGVRLQCAKCHNHPFDRWTQDDYYSWAAVFARIDYEIVENKRRDKYDKKEFNGEQLVVLKDEGEVRNERTGQDARPCLLADRDDTLDTGADRLQQLAKWLTSPSNNMFAQSQANRIWFHLMGRGLVDPVDDFRVTNPASHPTLLKALADDFVRSGFDVRHVIRVIMQSRAYQRAASSRDVSDLAKTNFASASVRRLTAEQLLDAQCLFLDVPAEFNGYETGIRAGQIPGVSKVRPRDKAPSNDDRFLTMFGKPIRQMSCECERSDTTSISQVFMLISGEGLNKRLQRTDGRLGRLMQSDLSHQQIIEELYWAALSRRPSAMERDKGAELLSSTDDKEVALQDIAWALINAKEFVFRY